MIIRGVYMRAMLIELPHDTPDSMRARRAIDPARVSYCMIRDANPYSDNVGASRVIQFRVDGQDLSQEYISSELAERVYNMLVSGWAEDYTDARTEALAERE